MKAQDAKTTRVHARIAPAALAMVKRAAELQGRSVSDFMVAAAQVAAQRAIEEAEIFRLSVEDQHAFARALLNPPAANKALARAAKLHADNVEVR